MSVSWRNPVRSNRALARLSGRRRIRYFLQPSNRGQGSIAIYRERTQVAWCPDVAAAKHWFGQHGVDLRDKDKVFEVDADGYQRDITGLITRQRRV